ncbi:MAG: hypothetical protein WDA07_10930 [Leucobacter sp.]
MSDDGRPNSLMMRLFRASAYLFGAVILLHLTIALAKELWWMFPIIFVVAVAIAGVRWWRRSRNPWN